MLQTTQDKEQIIMGTVCAAIAHIKNLFESNSKLSTVSLKLPKYEWNFKTLYESVSIGTEIPKTNIIPFKHGNYYAYLKQVGNFLDGFETGIQTSLNESLNSEQKLGLFDFRSDLKRIISHLESINDFENISNEVIKIKAFSNIPIRLFGFDISSRLISNPEIIKELTQLWGGNPNIISICYNRSTKSIYFIDLNQGIIEYLIKSDEFKLLYSGKIQSKDYLNAVKQITTYNNLVEVFANQNLMGFEYQDNLYNDVYRQIQWSQYVQRQKISK